MDLNTRINTHVRDYGNNSADSALIKHVQQFPGHAFNPGNTRLIWATRDVYQSQLLEASCIKLFPSCNRGPGDVAVSQTFASVCMRLAGVRNTADLSSRDVQGHTSIGSTTVDPVHSMAQPQGAHADAQTSNNVVDVANPIPPADVFIGSRIVDWRMQHLNVNNSDSHITLSQPNQGWVNPIVYDVRRSSSQPEAGDILHSPRRSRSRGLHNSYRLSYRRPGYECS